MSRRVSIRASLKPVPRSRPNGAVEWFARGRVPVRCPETGEIRRERRELRLAGVTSTARKTEADELNRRFEQDAEAVPSASLSFADAYLLYVGAGHPVPLYYKQILKGLGHVEAAQVDDAKVLALRAKLFKADAAASYVNRHLVTPVRAVLRIALRENAPLITRPKGHKARAEGTRIEIPDDPWFARVSPFMSADTLALLSFMTAHGRRLGDALGRQPADLDPEAGTLMIPRTKNGEPELVHLHPEVLRLILAMPDWQSRRWLFTDGPNSGSNVRRDVLLACAQAAGVEVSKARRPGFGESECRQATEAAGVRVYNPHAIGRHSFATRLLRAGYTLEYVARAGGWKSTETVSRLYAHLERKDWQAAVHRSADSVLGVMSGGKRGADQVSTANRPGASAGRKTKNPSVIAQRD